MAKILLAMSFYLAATVASARGNFGAGFVLGAPTGITGNYFLGNDRSLDLFLAWDLGKEDSLVLMADYLFHYPKSISLDSERLGWYYGFGISFVDWDDGPLNREDDDYRLGPRAVIGLDFWPSLKPFQFFGEVGLVMNLIPETDADLTLGLGFRYYF